MKLKFNMGFMLFIWEFVNDNSDYGPWYKMVYFYRDYDFPGLHLHRARKYLDSLKKIG